MNAELFQNLQTWNAGGNAFANKIALGLQVLGMLMIFIFFMLELTSTRKNLESEGGGMSNEVLASIAIKYLIAVVLVMSSTVIIDGFMELANVIAKSINGGKSTIDLHWETVIDAKWDMSVGTWIQKGILVLLRVIAELILWVAQFATLIIVIVRMVQILIYKAVAPIFLAFYMNDELKSTATSYLKQAGAIAFQSVILVLVLLLLPVIMKFDLGTGSSIGDWDFSKALWPAFTIFVKSIVALVLIFGSQSLAKRLMSAV